MPDRSGRELLEEWRGVLESVVSSASSAAGRPDLPRELRGAMQSQLALAQRALERERALGGELAGRILAPVDLVFDLLEESGATLRREAEALETAGRALQETAALIKRQAELFEQTIGALREPAELAKAAVGLQTRARPARGRAGSPARGKAGEPRGRAGEQRTAARRKAPARKSPTGKSAPRKTSSTAAKRGGGTAKARGAASKRGAAPGKD